MGIKVRSKYQGKNEAMNEVLPFGYETELVPKMSEEEVITPAKNWEYRDMMGKKRIGGASEIIIPKGTFEGITFIGANGLLYSTEFIKSCLGYKSIAQIFDKI